MKAWHKIYLVLKYITEKNPFKMAVFTVTVFFHHYSLGLGVLAFHPDLASSHSTQRTIGTERRRLHVRGPKTVSG